MLEVFDAIPVEGYVIGLMIALGLGVFLVLSQLEERNAARSTLRQLDG